MRRAGRGLLWSLGTLILVGGVNLVGIRMLGDVHGWADWLDRHSLHFLAWRLCLYGATAYGWWWMRARVLRREPVAETRTRLRRAEIAAVLAIFALEGTMLLQSLYAMRGTP